MAESKKSVIDIKIETANSAQSIKDMTKSLKGLKDELNNVSQGSAEWKKLSGAINDVEGKIGDLNDSFNTLKGSGIERVNSSIGLFKEGLGSLDFGKMGIALKGLGAAFKAVLPFAIIEGFKLLYENWEKVVAFAAKIIPALDTVSKKTHELEDENAKLLETNSKLNLVYETHITLLEAMGKKEKEVNQLKQQILDNDIKQLEVQAKLSRAKEEDAAATTTFYESALKLFHFDQMANEERTERLQKLTKETEKIEADLSRKRAEASANRIKAIDLEIKKTKEHSDEVIKKMLSDAKTEQTGKDEYLKNLDAKKKAEDEARQAKYKKDQELIMQTLEDEKYLKAQDELDKKKAMEDADALAQYQADKLNYSAQLQEEISANKKLSDEQERQRKLQQADEDIAIARNVAQSVQSLTDTVFAIKMAKVKKGSVEEEKLARRQFNINKALQLTLAGIDAAKAITTSLASAPLFVGTVPNPAGIAGLAAAITSSAAAIATIATKQFQPNGGGDTSAPTVNLGSVGGGESPTTSAPTTQVQPFTKLDEQGRNMNVTVNAKVFEGDMTSTQNRVSRLENQASFG